MQCRICFDEGDAYTLVTPCQCRGTSAFIHRACLDRYTQYYPDRICRVCHARFLPVVSPYDDVLRWVVVACLTALLLLSTTRLGVKLILFGVTVAVALVCIRRNLLTSTPLVALSCLVLLFLPGGHPTAVTIWIIVLGALAVLYVLVSRLPPWVLLAIVITLILSAYGIFFIILAYHWLDPPAFTILVCGLYMGWYLGIHEIPRLRLA